MPLMFSPTPNALIGARPAEMSQTVRNLEHAVAQCRDAIFIADAAGTISRVNPAFEKLTGYLSHEAVGKDLSALTADGPHSEDYRAIWERVLEQRPFSGSTTFRHKSGQRFRVEIVITPLLDSRSQIGNLVCTCNILENTAATLTDYDAKTAKPDQLNEVVHALNNMLMTVMAQAELSFESLPPEHAARVRMKGIRQACRRAGDLVRLLYEFEQQSEETAPEPLHYRPSQSSTPEADAMPARPAPPKARATAAG